MSLYHSLGFNKSKIIVLLLLLLLIVPLQYVHAEGSWQMGLGEGLTHEQPLFEYNNNYNNDATGLQPYVRPLFVDILNPDEVINISLCGTKDTDAVRTEIWNEAGSALLHTFINSGSNVACDHDFNSILTTPNKYVAVSPGTYQLRFYNDSGNDSDGIFKRFDVSVTADISTPVDPRVNAGRLWAERLAFRCTDGNSCYNMAHSTSSDLYAVVDGGFNNSYYVWQLDLDNFAGYAYEIQANNLGLDSPNPDGTFVAGFSACIDTDDDPSDGCNSVSGNRNTVQAMYKIYLSQPATVYPRPTTLPELTNFRFIDDEGVDDSISPSDTLTIQDTGTFLFSTNLATTGTYRIIIDITNDGVYGAGDVMLNGPAVPGDNSVNWNGKDNIGNAIANGAYNARIVLKTGEFHFTAADAETSGGPGNNGLTINAVLDNGVIDSSNTIYWDDVTALGLSHSDSYNGNGIHRYHNWGDFSDSGDGNRAYIDTYTMGTISNPIITRLAIEPDDTSRTAINGSVYNDLNGNGVRNAGEAGFENIVIEITENSSGTVFYVSTDVNGNYTAFTSDTHVTVNVDETLLPAGYVMTGGTDPQFFTLTPAVVNNVGNDGYQQQNDSVTDTVSNSSDINGNDPRPIPTLSEWMLILLSMLMALIGWNQYNRQMSNRK